MSRGGRRLGIVYMVGAGPGGQGLITRQGYDLLRRADVVVYDYLVDPVLLKDVKPGAETVCCAVLGKGHAGTDPAAQKRINSFLVKKARAGKCVVRLKSGDPMIFGRITEEIAPLVENKIPWEIVPGVTSASGAAASAALSLTQRRVSSSVTFVTGREAAGTTASVDWKTLGASGTLVLYMAVERAGKIAEELMAVRPEKTPVAVIYRACRADEVVFYTTLRDLENTVRKAKLKPPAIFIVGEAARCPKGLTTRAKRVLVTGTAHDPSKIQGTGVHVPLIAIDPLKDGRIDRHISALETFDWIMFTSRYGVECFFERLGALKKDARALNGLRIAVIGESTAVCLSDHGIRADVVAKEESSQGLLQALKRLPFKGKRVLIPCSALSRGTVAEGLRKSGADVVLCPVYRNVIPKGLPDLDLKLFHEIYFASPSGVRNFKKRYGRPVRGTLIRTVGDVTLAEAKNVFGKGYVYTTKHA